MQPDKIDWTKRVQESNGGSVFLPEEFKPAAEDIEAKRIAFNELIKQVAEKEIELNMTTQTMFYNLRKYLAANGRGDIWTKEVGFDAVALREKIYVVNLREQQRG